MLFEWDPAKDKANQRKHRVGFAEASTIFGDPHAMTRPDPLHSIDEQRYVTIGYASSGRLLIVIHADREERIRIISARPATAVERKVYEESNER